MTDPIEAMGNALRGEFVPISRIGIAYSKGEARRIRWLRRLRWMPLLRGELRAQRRLLKQIDRPRPDRSTVEGFVRHALDQSLQLRMHVAMIGWNEPMSPDPNPFPRIHVLPPSTSRSTPDDE
jgi:hypothetical protein